MATSKENLGAAIRRVGTLDHMWHIVETLSTHEITRIHVRPQYKTGTVNSRNAVRAKDGGINVQEGQAV